MIASWKRDPFGFFLSIALLGAGLAIAFVMTASLGAEVIPAAQQAPQNVGLSWWVTQGPQFYPGSFAAAAFALMLVAFKVYMHAF